jgi:ribonuclease BN (tRNA processing enzyme)
MDPGDLTAIVITHEHPDHCVDVYGLHVLLRYALERSGVPLYAPAGADDRLGTLAHWGDTFDWHAIEDHGHATIGAIDLGFSRTDHPPPTFAVEATGPDGRRLVYTSDTGPGWSIDAFAPGAELVLSEASYEEADLRSPIHLSGKMAGAAAREARAQRLVLTHLWPRVDPAVVCAEGSEAFGQAVTMAAVDLTLPI